MDYEVALTLDNRTAIGFKGPYKECREELIKDCNALRSNGHAIPIQTGDYAHIKTTTGAHMKLEIREIK